MLQIDRIVQEPYGYIVLNTSRRTFADDLLIYLMQLKNPLYYEHLLYT